MEILLKMVIMTSFDQYRYVSKNGKTWIAELEKRERDITGIKSLKSDTTVFSVTTLK